MYKCLVTGHKGYIGSKLFKKLKENGYNVVGIDIKDGKNILNDLPNENFDFVFHMASSSNVNYCLQNPFETINNNVLATSKLLEWSKNHNVKRVIFSSTSTIYGNDIKLTNLHGLHKKISEEECKFYSNVYDLDTVSLRYFSVFSEDQHLFDSQTTIISSWKKMIQNKNCLKINGDGSQERDFVHVDDVVSANIFCMNYDEKFNGKNFDVGSGKTISLKKIKEIIDKYNKVSWEYTDTKTCGISKTLANVENFEKINWKYSIDPTQAIERCFKNY